ncbi:Cof-type HAD-IIB family hydrolase [uncultured Dubosiella sp.]|uniref:Cof-type HAD-IIB family hydrolase n=1 Tax=uncultured Dubosiella sp. TaxID=1937011 RepID=UPI0027311BCB|nr:Cof-type HAD-IIB family hydrolase [uncultured Dubosiella sp.]
MKPDIRLVAVDIDGTFVHSDYTYDRQRFERLFEAMKKAGCRFVAASGNQYAQLRDVFGEYAADMAFVAENGAYVQDRNELVFAANMDRQVVQDVIEALDKDSAIQTVRWGDDFRMVGDQILKFALTVPEEKTSEYCEWLRQELNGKVEPTTSGHGSIDLIVPGCHKASGLKRLVERWGIRPEQCAAFGDGGNDIEMLQYCGYSFAMDNADKAVKKAAKFVCPSNEEDGVLVVLEQWFGEK